MPLLAPLEEGCRWCPHELVGLAGVSSLAEPLQDPHQLKGAAQLPAQHSLIQHGHEPQRPGDDPGAGCEPRTVDPEGIGEGDGVGTAHVQALAGRLGRYQGARHHAGEVGRCEHVERGGVVGR